MWTHKTMAFKKSKKNNIIEAILDMVAQIQY